MCFFKEFSVKSVEKLRMWFILSEVTFTLEVKKSKLKNKIRMFLSVSRRIINLLNRCRWIAAEC